MTALLSSIFGANWRTSLFGVLQLVVGTAVNYYQSLAPGAAFDWKTLAGQVVVAIALLLTKDANVTGGTIPSGTTPTPEATAQAVAAVQAKQ